MNVIVISAVTVQDVIGSASAGILCSRGPCGREFDL